MIPAEYNTTIQQGSTFRRTFTVTTESFDLSQLDSIRMNIRKYPTGELIWNSEDADSGSYLQIDLENNSIVWLLSAELTESFEFRTAGFDIELVKNTDPETVDKCIKGKLTLIKEYTYNEQSA